MGTMPMQEDVGQEIYTRDYGIVKVDKTSWMDGGFHIVLCPNGAYQHINGLPVKDEGELRKAFGSNAGDLEKALNWFRNRHEQLANPPRPITFRGDNTPVFADGSIPEESDLYNFFSPGPILSAAIVGLHLYRQRKESGEKPQELRKAAAPPVQVAPAPDMGGDTYTPPPTPDPLKYSSRARKEAREKAARQAKAKAAKAAKATQPAPPPQG